MHFNLKTFPYSSCKYVHSFYLVFYLYQWNGTLLLISCHHGKIEAVEKLLQLGAHINAIDEVEYDKMYVNSLFYPVL